jgi:hypothetical protein
MTPYYKIHLNLSTGEREAIVAVVAKQDLGFYLVQEKGTNNLFTVHEHKLGTVINKKKARK